jgi:hypothetical protein
MGKLQRKSRSMKKRQKQALRKEKIELIDTKLPARVISYVKQEQARDKGASSWLNALPIEDQQFVLNKGEFKDALRLRYNIELENLPTVCPCGERFDVTHALTCGKGDFVIERHDNVKNTLTTLLDKVCVDVESEPHLLPVTNETLQYKTVNTKDDARLDIKAKSF